MRHDAAYHAGHWENPYPAEHAVTRYLVEHDGFAGQQTGRNPRTADCPDCDGTGLSRGLMGGYCQTCDGAALVSCYLTPEDIRALDTDYGYVWSETAGAFVKDRSDPLPVCYHEPAEDTD